MEDKPPQRKQENVTFPAIYAAPDDPAQGNLDKENMDQSGSEGVIIFRPEDILPIQRVGNRLIQNGVKAARRWLFGLFVR
jgi:hypothetical protein